jgi:hypothetical protein
MLDGTIPTETYSEANEEFCAEIAVTEQELRAIVSQGATPDAFLRFSEIHLLLRDPLNGRGGCVATRHAGATASGSNSAV